MNIQIVTGTGKGPTKLAAFDAALISTGVANYNLIRLSSIIPPDSKITQAKKVETPIEDWGKRLYVVMADDRVSSPNFEAWAGIGWVQDEETGRGLFVEHEGNSEDTVKQNINDSLHALMASRHIDPKTMKMHMEVIGTVCENKPVCALALAVFKTEDWEEAYPHANE
jgi:arginine decarboxylase